MLVGYERVRIELRSLNTSSLLSYYFQMSQDSTTKKAYRVLDLTPKPDQASKPTELIQIHGHQALTLNSRRSITLLWHNAHRQGVKEGKDYTIEMADLVPVRHKGYEMVEEAVLQLMQTIITIKRPDGSTRRVQFLGGNDMDDPRRSAGMLTYSFDKRLVEVLQDSTIWGKIDLPVLMSLSSKYAVSLYESLSQLAGLDHKTAQQMTLNEFREMLGVENHKYEKFGELNKHVLKPIVAEINALASFNLAIVPIKTSKKVTHIRLSWWLKTLPEHKAAWSELQQSRVGRKARINDQVEMVFAPSASPRSIARNSLKRPTKP